MSTMRLRGGFRYFVDSAGCDLAGLVGVGNVESGEGVGGVSWRALSRLTLFDVCSELLLLESGLD